MVVSPSETAAVAVQRRSFSQGISLLAFCIGVAAVLLAILGFSWYAAWVISQAASEGKPSVTFYVPTVDSYGATIAVASVSPAYAPSNFLVNLAVNGVLGLAVSMPQYSYSSVIVYVSGDDYQISWTDVAYDSLLNGGDYFRISNQYGPMPASSAFTFYLLWRDGSTIASVVFYTP